MLQVSERKTERSGVEFHADIMQLDNGVLLILYEGSARLGTLAFAMPGAGELQAARSSVLVGAKYMVAARALAERGAAKFGRMCLASLYTTLDEPEAFRIFAKLLDGDVETKQRSQTES